MNKKVYEMPSVKIIAIEAVDIICTSGEVKLTSFDSEKLLNFGRIDAE